MGQMTGIHSSHSPRRFIATGLRYIAAAALLGAASLVFGCESKSEEQSNDEEARAEVPAVEWTPAYEGAHASARDAVGLAIRDGMSRTIPAVRPELLDVSKKRENARPASFDRQITVLFGANVHGELEDCGCKANPLGGLARRKKLIDLAANPDSDAAKKWWKTPPPADSTLFVADVGDLFYKSTSLKRANPALQTKAKKTASAIVDALNAAEPDVVNVGELDLVFGLDNLQALAESASFPLVSANLKDAQGEYPFPGHEIVERNDLRVAFIGLTKQKPRISRYYEERDVALDDPRSAYVRELESLTGDVDLVVMMSNLGMNDTRGLVESLRSDGKRVDAVLVSNSNRRTMQPVWASGVPMVEPASRGKFYGHLDISLGSDDQIEYANAAESPVEAYQSYVSAWSSYANARSERERMVAKVAGFRQQLAEGASEEAPGASDEEGEPSEKALQGRINYLTKRLDVMDTRVERTSKTLSKRHANLKPLSHYEEPGEGDDWATADVVQVHIDIPQDNAVKDVVDRWKKKIDGN